MHVTQLISIVLQICILSNPVSEQYRVGDMVVVIHDADIKDGEQVVQRVHRGLPLTVEGVEKGRVWVSHHAAGWIQADDIATPSSAIGIFSDAICAGSQGAEDYAARGAALACRGDIELAIADFDEVVRLAPTRAGAYCSRGLCWAMRQDFDRAIADFDDAIRLDPADAVTLNNRAHAWLKKGEFDAAITDASEAIRVAPRLEAAFANRATAWAGKGQFDRAKEDCRTAHCINPKSGTAFNEVAWFLATTANTEHRNGPRAVDFAKQACEASDWKNAGALDTLAAAHAECADFDAAANCQRNAVNLASVQDKGEFQIRLTMYKAGRAYREPPVKSTMSRPRP